MQLNIKIFADGADKASMLEMYRNPLIQGFTTNPTLMRKAGITDYEAFAKDILKAIPDRPISFEVFSDDFNEMYRQALKIASWGRNVYVKIPIANTQGQSAAPLIRQLSRAGVKQNITAILTLEQIEEAVSALENSPPAFISVFAGRIADTGRDPLPIMKIALDRMKQHTQIELIWASPREVLNIVQANEIGCHIITATHDLIHKIPLFGKDLHQFSLETIQMFHNDALKAGYALSAEEWSEA